MTAFLLSSNTEYLLHVGADYVDRFRVSHGGVMRSGARGIVVEWARRLSSSSRR